MRSRSDGSEDVQPPLGQEPVPTTAPSFRRGGGKQGRRAPLTARFSSIEYQLPLLIGLLLVPTVALLVGWTYTAARHALLLASGTRLEGTARELASMVSTGVQARLSEAQHLASNEAVRAFLVSGGSAAEQAAREQLAQAPDRSSRTNITELWSPGGALLLQVASPPDDESEADPDLLAHPSAAPTEPGVSPFQVFRDSASYAVVAEVRSGEDGTGELLGHVLMRRWLSSNQAATLLAHLIGPGARLLLGNRDGDTWTNLEGPVAPPPEDARGAEQGTYRAADGAEWVGGGVFVERTPWILRVERDALLVLRPARSMVLRTSLVGVALLILAGGFAWSISRRISNRLREATDAADSIATGRYERRLEAHGPSELRGLTKAFNLMAGQVEQTTHELEERVASRTSDLRNALAQLGEAQSELVRKEKLALLGQVAGGVGHELRNPLGVMTNAVYYLELILEPEQPEVREYLGILRHQIGVSEKIISDLLDSTRTRLAHPEEVRLDELADQQVERLALPSIEVVRDYEQDAPAAWVDPVQAGQVVINLLTNAVQAMEDGGTLTLSVRRRAQGSVALTVSDSGPGVAKDIQDHIFEPLFTTRARGIGLGLSVSRRLAENNAGSLAVESPAEGVGATFVLSLPTATEGMAG